MYAGWMMINGLEVINSHRAINYARTAGISGIYGCSSCTSVMAADPNGGRYQSPLLDTANRPPWWPPSGTNLEVSDALDFLGVLGVEIDGADDSMRDIKVTEGTASGGYLGPLRYRSRELAVKAVLVAGSECALGYGLNWLRSVDSVDSCESSTVTLYQCCPHVHASDCVDLTCKYTCIAPYQRTFKGARITAGPTVLRQFDLISRGVVAEVEFLIKCGDPAVYGEYVTPLPLPVSSVDWVDQIQTDLVLEDGFATAPVLPPPPSLQPAAVSLPRTRWSRQQVDVNAPGAGGRIHPVITLASDDGVSDLRLTIVGDTGSRQYVLGRFPAGGSVTLDFAARTVTTRHNGHEEVRNTFMRNPNGSPVAWPKSLDPGGYTVLVDRPVDTTPLQIGAVSVGLVAA